MTDYAALKAELARPEFAGLSDAQIAAALKADMRMVARDVPIGEMEGALRLMPAVTAMEDWLAAHPSPSPARTAVGELLGMIGGKIAVVEMSRPIVAATIEDQLRAIVAAELLTEAEAAYLLSLGQRQVTRAEQLGWPGDRLTDQEIKAARSFQ